MQRHRKQLHQFLEQRGPPQELLHLALQWSFLRRSAAMLCSLNCDHHQQLRGHETVTCPTHSQARRNPSFLQALHTCCGCQHLEHCFWGNNVLIDACWELSNRLVTALKVLRRDRLQSRWAQMCAPTVTCPGHWATAEEES